MKFLKELPSSTIKKGTTLQQAGEVTKSAYRVIKGCLKSYVIDHSGKEHIVQFAPEGWIISDMDSYYNRTPSVLFIEAIEETEVVAFAGGAMNELRGMDEETLVFIAEKQRNSLIASNKRLIALLSASAEERYIEFTQTYPTLVQRLPLKLIASYIGITPEYLSEIRRRIAGK